MLTAFFAIIRDSFRAAMASRVLYVLLALITLVLLILAPLHIRESLDWKISLRRHVQDEVRLALKIYEGSQPDAAPGLKRIWEGLSDDTREALKTLGQADNPNNSQLLDGTTDAANPVPLRARLVIGLENDLNELLQSENLYEPEMWGKNPGDEARGLVERGVESLNKSQRRRLNRLLVTQTLTGEVSPADASSLEVWYGPWQFEFMTVSTTRAEFTRGFSSAVSYIFDKFVMSIGLFIAILVTSNMIPEMFEPGSLNLLLSKPVPRWLLLVGKFVGGCAFISLCAVYLFLGLWLWMGLAAGLWDRGMLWSIPLYIVVFAIYFSVSMLVGILYRSAIVSVILTVVFWGVCFGIGTVWGLFDHRVQNDRIISSWQAGEETIAADSLQRVFRWSETDHEWDELIGHKFAIPQQEVAIGVAQFFAAFPPQHVLGAARTENGQLLLGTPSSFDPEREGSRQLQLVSADGMSEATDLGPLPFDAVAIVQGSHGPVVVSSSGQFQSIDLKKILAAVSAGEAADAAAAKPDGDLPEKNLPEKNLPENDLPADNLFVDAGPEQAQQVRDADRIAVNPVTGDLLVMNRNQLVRFVWNAADKKYVRAGDLTIESGSNGRSMSGWLVAAGSTAVAAWGNGTIVSIDLDTMAERKTFRPSTTVAIRDLLISPAGERVLVLYRDGSLWEWIPGDEAAPRKRKLPVRGAVEGIDFLDETHLLVSHAINHVSTINLAEDKVDFHASPRGNFVHNAYNWLINPFYQLAPKPGEFYKLVEHLSARNDSSQSEEIDLTDQEYTRSPWGPLWSGFLFMGVMLGLGCVLFMRQDY